MSTAADARRAPTTLHLRGRVAVTPRSLSGGHPALDPLTAAGLELVFPAPGRTPTPEELLRAVPGCVAYLAGVEPVDEGLIAAAAPTLRVIARNGVGVDNIDLAAARAHDVEVCPAVGANAQGVAELTVGLLFAAARHLPWSDAQMKLARWERRGGRELAGRTLGVVGLGNIGRRVAEMAAAIGLRVVGHDPFRPQGWVPPAAFEWADTLSDVASRSDLLTLHVPAAGVTLIDREVLGRMRPGSILVNTSRGELVDESALLSALDTGHVAAYAVDAFTAEPPRDWRLASHERVIASPHIGGFTAESVERAAAAAVHAVLDGLSRRSDVGHPR